MVILSPQHIKDLPGQHPSARIFSIKLRKPLRPLGQRLDRRHLKRLEHSRIHLALHLQDLRNDLRLCRNQTDSPSRHVMSLAQGIQLKAALLRTRLGKNRQRPVVQNETVWIVITYKYAMPAAEIHQLRIEILRSRRTCRHVRIIRPHDLDP